MEGMSKKYDVYVNFGHEDQLSGRCQEVIKLLRDEKKIITTTEEMQRQIGIDTPLERIIKAVVEQSEKALSFLSGKTHKKLEENPELLIPMLEALSLTLEHNNRRKHIIVCDGIKGQDIDFRLRWFNPVVEMDRKGEWKKELMECINGDIKSLQTLEYANIGYGLAWCHYNGILRLFEKEDTDPFSNWKAEDDIQEKTTKTFVVLIPQSCSCAPKVIPDKAIEYKCKSPQISYERAGKPRKAFFNIYEIKGKTQSLYVPIQYAASIETLSYLNDKERKHSGSKVKPLPEERMKSEFQMYRETLEEIIEARADVVGDKILVHTICGAESQEDIAKPLLKKLEELEKGKKIGEEKGGKGQEKVKQIVVVYGSNERDKEHALRFQNDMLAQIKEQHGSFAIRLFLDQNQEPLTEGILRDKNIKTSDHLVLICTERFMENFQEKCDFGGVFENLCKKNDRRCTVCLYENKDQIPQGLNEDFVHLVKRDARSADEVIKIMSGFRAPLFNDRVRFENIAEGLAWNYYSNYLLLNLDELKPTLLDSQHVRDSEGQRRMSYKLFVLLPKSGTVKESISKEDEAFQIVKEPDIRIIKKDVACQERRYTPTLYTVKDNDEEYVIAAEYLTPLRNLSEIHKDYFTDVADAQYQREVAKLMDLVKAIKQDNILPEVQDKLVLVSYDDEKEGELRRTLLKLVKEEIDKEEIVEKTAKMKMED